MKVYLEKVRNLDGTINRLEQLPHGTIFPAENGFVQVIEAESPVAFFSKENVVVLNLDDSEFGLVEQSKNILLSRDDEETSTYARIKIVGLNDAVKIVSALIDKAQEGN